MLEQLVAEVNAVPEADDVALDGDVVLSVKPEMTNVGELVTVYSSANLTGLLTKVYKVVSNGTCQSSSSF